MPHSNDSVQAQLNDLSAMIGESDWTATAVASAEMLRRPLSVALALELSALRSQSLRELGRVGEAIASLEDALARLGGGGLDDHDPCLRTELINRCLLSSLYESECFGVSAAHPATAAGSNGCSAADVMTPATKAKAIANYDRSLALAGRVGEYETLTYCTVGLAELHMSRRDLASASAAFDRCVAACGGVAEPALRSSLLQRVLPLSVEVLNMQGRTEEGFARWRAFNDLLAAAGRSIPDECPICADEFTPQQACAVLGCGHSFHRTCCDTWLGTRMFMTGEFRAECPLCKQLDASLKPTPAAVQALADYKRSCEEGGGSGSGSGSGSDSEDHEGSGSGSSSGSGDESDGAHAGAE